MALTGQSDSSADVVVIGGGPGGSTAATMLSRQGFRVVLMERESFPREHVGESLLPASMVVLDELGVLPAVQQAGFLPKWGATMLWGRDKTPWSWYFKETNQKYPHSYQVSRPEFDQILLDNSRKAGVDVREGHRVTQVIFDDGRAIGVRYESAKGESKEIPASFVVDASGQGGLIARQLALRQWDPFFRNLAFLKNGIYRAGGYAGITINTFIGMNYEEIWALIETVYRADFDTISMFTADATIANYKRHLSSILFVYTL